MGYISDWKEKGYAHYLERFFYAWNNNGSMDDSSRQILKALEEVGYFRRDMFDQVI